MKYLRMTIAVTLAFSYADPGVATVLYEAHSLQDSVAQAEVVAHVRIKKIEPHQFRDGNRVATCGKDYIVDVLATFKGEPRGRRTFTVHDQPHAVLFHEVKPGDELVVLLIPRQEAAPPEGGSPDVITPPPSPAEIRCRAQLSSTTLLHGEMGGFPLIVRTKTADATEQAISWIAYDATYTKMPQSLMDEQVPYDANCKGRECERASRRMVPWKSLKAQIARWVQDVSSEVMATDNPVR